MTSGRDTTRVPAPSPDPDPADPRPALARLAAAAVGARRVWFGPSTDPAADSPAVARVPVDETTQLYAEPAGPEPWTPDQLALLALAAGQARCRAADPPAERELLEAISQGRPLPEVLERLVRRLEFLCPGMIGSIQLVDDAGETLLASIAPGLPPAYCAAVEHVRIGPCAGSCGTAAYRREPVIVEDIATDPLWAALRPLAELGGVRACWSYPIFAASGQVTGTFALYYREVRRPAEAELRHLREMTDLAAVAISSWRAQDNLERAIDQLRRQLSEIPSLLWRSDAAGRCESASQAWLDFTGQTLEQMRGDGWLDCVHPEDREPIRAACLEALAARAPLACELRLRRADGQWRWLTCHGQAYHDATGRFLGYTHSCFDITERKTSEVHLELATGALGLGIWEWNIPARTLQWDRHCAQTVGLPLYEVQGTEAYWRDRIHPDDLAAVDAALASHLRGETAVHDCEYRLLTVNRGYRWVFVRGCVTARVDGRATRMTGTLIDIDERRRTEQALAESEETLRSVLQSSPASILTVDTALRVTFATHPEAFPPLGAPARESVEPAYRDALESTIREVLATRSIRTIELEARSVHHTVEWYSITIGPLYRHDAVSGAILSGIEISERRRAEEEARVHRERFELAVRGSKASLWDQNLPSRSVTYSPRFLEMLGFTAAEVGDSAQFWESRLHPDDRAHVLQAFQRHLETDALYDVEYRLLTKSGEYRWFNTRGQALRDSHGVPFRVAGSTIDITARRLAEQAVRDSEARYRVLFEASPQPKYVYDPRDGRILAANAAACHLYRSTPPALIGRSVSELRIPGTGSRHRRCDGSEVEVEYREHPIQLNGIAARLALVTDMTRQRQLESQLLQAQKMEAFGQLAGGVAHDFNNLLTVINGYSKLASRKLTAQPAIQHDVDLVRAAGERAARLTRQLLAFARRQLVLPQRVDLPALLEQCQLILHPLLGGRVRLTIRCAPELPAVEADPGQLEQVFLNLAVNARDAMPDGGDLSIEVSTVTTGEPGVPESLAPGPYVRIAVRDTGHGIPPEAMPHLFEPFYTTKPVGQGTGLGLSTVYGIITQAHGHVAVQSTPGAGACFLLYLPALPAAPPEPAAVPVRDPAAAPREATVLVVEDEAGISDFIRHVLASRSYRVVVAGDGAAAVELLARDPSAIDLVLTDIVMPRLGGAETAEALRALAPGLPVIFMSGFAAELPAAIAGAAVLQKPFTEELLLETVAQALAAGRPPAPGGR